jgi:hypothetical protein
VGPACVEHVVSTADVGGSLLVDLLRCATEDRGGVDDRVAPLGRPDHVVLVGDVALEGLDADGGERFVLAAGADERPDLVAVGQQQPGDVGADQAGGPGDQILRHGELSFDSIQIGSR